MLSSVTNQIYLYLLKVVVSRKWGFTKWDTEEYQKLRAEGRLQPDGIYCHYYGNNGPFDQWIKIQRKNRGLATR